MTASVISFWPQSTAQVASASTAPAATTSLSASCTYVGGPPTCDCTCVTATPCVRFQSANSSKNAHVRSDVVP